MFNVVEECESHWISMLSLLKCIMAKYKSLVANMHCDYLKNKPTNMRKTLAPHINMHHDAT
jgi:acyl-CoA thioesterase FadM